jgi:hypothetical protein
VNQVGTPVESPAESLLVNAVAHLAADVPSRRVALVTTLPDAMTDMKGTTNVAKTATMIVLVTATMIVLVTGTTTVGTVIANALATVPALPKTGSVM